ncbi:MAG: RPA family protein [Thermoplasmata archaeon]
MRRETAWRIFSGELNLSKKKIVQEGDKAITYVLTPLGAKVRRVFIVGVLVDMVPAESEDGFTKAKVSDGTSNFFIKASKYQDSVRKSIENLVPPLIVALSGKISVYNPEPDKFWVSIIPENITKSDENVRKYWIYSVAKRLNVRINAMDEAKKMKDPTLQMLMDLGFPKSVSENTLLALKEYGGIDVEPYINMLEYSLKSISPGYQDEEFEIPTIEEPEESKDKEYENKILSYIERYDYDGKGVKYEDLREYTEKEKISSEKLDEILESLENDGITYQPTFGYIKKV